MTRIADPHWLDKPNILFKEDRLSEVNPFDKNLAVPERLNALARLSLVALVGAVAVPGRISPKLVLALVSVIFLAISASNPAKREVIMAIQDIKARAEASVSKCAFVKPSENAALNRSTYDRDPKPFCKLSDAQLDKRLEKAFPITGNRGMHRVHQVPDHIADYEKYLNFRFGTMPVRDDTAFMTGMRPAETPQISRQSE